MITQMTKYSFLVHHAQYSTFLEKLRTLGLLHIDTLEQGSDAYESLRDKFALQLRIDKQIDSCNNLINSSDEAPHEAEKTLSIESGMVILNSLETLQKEEEHLLQLLTASQREQLRMEVWGKYSPEQTDKLIQAGYTIGFYSCLSRNYNSEWESQHNAFTIDSIGNTSYFITVSSAPIADIDAEQFKMSDLSSDMLKQAVIDAEHKHEAKQEKIRLFAQHNINNIKCLKTLIDDEINIDKVHINTVKAADNTVMVLEGYCPDDTREALNTMLSKEGVYYEANTPRDEDNVPIKLHNNAFTRLFEPLTGMYGIPSYQEYDPTPILAPFFLLFFAMCMGDGGYGIILILFGLGVKYKKINIEMFDGLGNIITTLGVGTTIVGFFLGTAFGIDLYTASFVPESLKAFMIRGTVAGFDIQMALAIAVGVVHICLALTIKAIGYTQRYGFKKNISTWGWLFLILGGLITSLLAISETFSVSTAKIALITIGCISALGIYIFNDTQRNVFMNIGAGLWDTYNMATGLLGDVLSYIRLYALGLAGGMLGGAFNTLGLMVLGDEPSILSWIPFIIILLLGHMLNLAMSVLGAFVHPLRLTFVEYFKNSGYEGKGEKYAPLTKTAN